MGPLYFDIARQDLDWHRRTSSVFRTRTVHGDTETEPLLWLGPDDAFRQAAFLGVGWCARFRDQEQLPGTRGIHRKRLENGRSGRLAETYVFLAGLP